MIHGTVNDDVPVIELPVGQETFVAIIDTGFNGHLELPAILFDELNPEFEGELVAELAGGQSITEDVYRIRITFDGREIDAIASFVEGHDILLGTKMLAQHRLAIDFPACTVLLERVTTSPEGNGTP